jgi:hypothetical protein
MGSVSLGLAVGTAYRPVTGAQNIGLGRSPGQSGCHQWVLDVMWVVGMAWTGWSG